MSPGKPMEPAPYRVEVDNRGRINLGRRAAGKTFRVTPNRDGSILLEPVRLMTEAEIAALRVCGSCGRVHASLSEELAAHGDPGS